MKGPSGAMLLAIGIAIAAVAIVAGVWRAGGPIHARQERFDRIRSGDLASLSTEIDRYFRESERLPSTIDELEPTARRAISTTDPSTGEPYGYRTLDEATYELCADFQTVSRRTARWRAKFWVHGSGRICFEMRAEPG